MKSSGPEVFFVGGCLFFDSWLFLVLQVYIHFQFFSSSVLVVSVLLGLFPFYLGFSNFLACSSLFSHKPFLCNVDSNAPSDVSNWNLLAVLFLLPLTVSLDKDQFCWSLYKTVFGFVDFSDFCFQLDFHSNLFIFFFLLFLGYFAFLSLVP